MRGIAWTIFFVHMTTMPWYNVPCDWSWHWDFKSDEILLICHALVTRYSCAICLTKNMAIISTLFEFQQKSHAIKSGTWLPLPGTFYFVFASGKWNWGLKLEECFDFLCYVLLFMWLARIMSGVRSQESGFLMQFTKWC